MTAVWPDFQGHRHLGGVGSLGWLCGTPDKEDGHARCQIPAKCFRKVSFVWRVYQELFQKSEFCRSNYQLTQPSLRFSFMRPRCLSPRSETQETDLSWVTGLHFLLHQMTRSAILGRADSFPFRQLLQSVVVAWGTLLGRSIKLPSDSEGKVV